jgi:cell wall-associated NlpC family hydrolase
MIKSILPATVIALVLGSCNTFKPLALMGNKQVKEPVQKNNEIKFIDEISVVPQSSSTTVGSDNNDPISKSEEKMTGQVLEPVEKPNPVFADYTSSASIEKANAIQFKYSVLLNTEVEKVKNITTFQYIDGWLGTRYCMGGTTKRCIDCSAFTQSFYSALYNTTIPRTARNQYAAAQRVSKSELQEGDLVFFNTRGGISHVGVYLQNNKFVHASSSKGIMISDLSDSYWSQRFISAGKLPKESMASSQ